MVSRYYAKGGFLVVKPDYRGHGRSEGKSEITASWIFDYTIDTLNLLAGLAEIPDADTGNVFLYGHSMGGEVALRMLMVDQKQRIKAATLWAGMSEDFSENIMYFVGRRPESRELFQSRLDKEFTPDQYESLSLSPYMESVDVPLLIHHGTADESVPFEWSLSLAEQLD